MTVKSCEKLEKSRVALTIETSAEEFEAAVNKAYLKMRGKINVPGFRVGKAPRKIIEKMYGAEVFYEEAVNIILPDAYEAAVKEQELNVVGYPEVELESCTKDGVVFKCTVAIYPEVKLGQYKGLEAPKAEVKVAAADVNARLKEMADRNSRLVSVDRAVKKGDTADIDFEGFDNGKAFDGGKGENFDLEIGSGSFVPGFEEQIVGMKAGDERDVVVTFPENYVEALAGKEATFKVTVKSVKEPELPELDDELAKDISDYETIAEYRDHVREDLEKEFTEQQESDYATRLMKAAVDNMTVEIPEPMILAKLDEQLRNYISTMGISPELTREQVLASMGLDEKTFQEIMRPQAVFELQTDLLLDAIVKAENIELDEGELDETYNKMAEEYKMEVDKIKQYVDEKIIVLDMKRRKAAQLIRDTAVDKEPEAKEEAAETKEEAAE